MRDWREQIRDVLQFAGEAAAETLWPTRCVICDMPGKVLCERCERDLPFIDWWRACRRCGAPYGYVQCGACDPVSLAAIGRDGVPYDGCASAVQFDGRTGCIVRGYKDQGERRLASVMASLMVRALPPSWPVDAVAFVPATLSAYRYRGFDHIELIAREIARQTDVACLAAFERPKTKDQRGLTAEQRAVNVDGRYRVKRALDVSRLPSRLILVDDVYTTGATLCAATETLRGVGVREVRCLTFARV